MTHQSRWNEYRKNLTKPILEYQKVCDAADLSRILLAHIIFVFNNCKGRKAQIRRMKISEGKLSNLNLKEIEFHLTFIDNCQFRNTKLQKSLFYNSYIYFSDFSGADLEGANFVDCKIRSCNFDGAEVKGLNLHKSDIPEKIKRELLKRGAIDVSTPRPSQPDDIELPTQKPLPGGN